ncbi:MAG: tetraacyldisaccharide 4'-kinase [Desulfotalea sp.]
MNKKKWLFTIGYPFSSIYSYLMKARVFLYEKGILKSVKADIPIISVGNLTMGGTGKTPTTHYIARLLQNNGFSPAIISRGYSGKASKEINIVSNTETILLSPREAGDEPYMLASMLPGVPVITGRKRILTTSFAIKEYGVNVLLLDDGFQHLPVQRDCDLVLFDAKIGFGNNRVFPGGDLRESYSALARASALVITGNIIDHKKTPLYDQLMKSSCQLPIFSLKRTTSVYFDKHKKVVTTSEIPQNIQPFSGIANPDRFYNDLRELGFSTNTPISFDDHHIYQQSDIDYINKQVKDNNCSAIITTEKDFVKLQDFTFATPIFFTRPQLNAPPGFDDFILSFLKKEQQ